MCKERDSTGLEADWGTCVGGSNPSKSLFKALPAPRVVVQFTELGIIKEEENSLRSKMIPSSGTF